MLAHPDATLPEHAERLAAATRLPLAPELVAPPPRSAAQKESLIASEQHVAVRAAWRRAQTELDPREVVLG